MRWSGSRNDNAREITGPHVCLIGSGVSLEFVWKQQAPLTVLYLDAAFAREVLGRTLKGVSFFDSTLIALHDMQAVQWIHLLARLGQPRRTSERLYLECVSTVLAVHLLGVANLVAQSSLETTAKLPIETFNRIHKFIADNLAEKITLDQLAKVAAMSRSHFVRLFKGTAGMSPYHYVLRQRVLRACELIRATEHRITEIGFEVGFNDVADFNHMFKKFMQCSPRQFRKMSHPIFPT
jgi:AraC-like DNA-binding protein